MDEKDLIRKINDGDENAFREMYEFYFHKVVNYADKIVHSREEAKEIAQDVFVKLWNKRFDLDPERSVSGLIFKITKLSAIDRIRRLVTEVKTLNITTASEIEIRSLESEYLDEELYQTYRHIVSKLPEKRRMIFQLSRDKNLSYKEIAAKLDISTKTVETQIRLALNQIREDLKHYSDSLLITLIILFLN